MTSSQNVRVRFAPSPTGFLHIGGVRTALFNWLYARRHGGKFILRIEDTDTARSEDRFTQDIFESMKWLGMSSDEEPLFQSRRLPIYARKTEELIAAGNAYRCVCTEAAVEAMREEAMKAGKKPMYDRRCREKRIGADVGKPFVVRVKVPLEGAAVWDDLIRGDMKIDNSEVDDFVIVRSDGGPTYNLSVVIDDVESRITHVIRGEEHTTNTPKQIHLYNFFGYPQPKFAHLPVILAADKKKLSKRHGAVATSAYRAEGCLPEGLLNFLARLGWSHGDQEIFTIAEMIQYFGFDHVQKSSAVFNTEKLQWTNATHIKSSAPDRLIAILAVDFAPQFSARATPRLKTPLAGKLTALIQPKVKLLKEIAEQLSPLCEPGAVDVDSSTVKWGKDGSLKAQIQAGVKFVTDELAGKIAGAARVARAGEDSAWGDSPSLGDIGMGHAEVDAYLRAMSEKAGLKLGDLTGPMRLAVSGRATSVGLFDLLPLLPWDVVEPRLRKVERF